MKKSLLITGLILPFLATAAAPIDGFYASAFGGYAYLPNNVNVIHNGLYFSNAKYEGGYAAGGRFGFKTNPLRYEGELTFITAEIDRFKLNGVRTSMPSGYSNTAALMANFYYDMPQVLSSIEPFLGAGVGYAWTKNQFSSANPFGLVRYTESGSNFAYQFTTGIAYNFAENFSLDGAYRYFATNNVQHLGDTYQANLATLGLTYRFDGARYK